MALFYYYIEGDSKKGPFTIEELQTLNLPISTSIWSDGWKENKLLSDCPEVLDYFILNPPDIPVVPQSSADNITPTTLVGEPLQEEKVAIYPEMHWLPSMLMYLGILACIGQFIMAFINNDSGFAIVIDIIFVIWGGVSIGGMIAQKKWALISYFSYRIIMCLLLIWLVSAGESTGDDFVKDFISLLMVFGIFFIKKDGYNVYELLWNNGVFYVQKEKQVEVATDETDTSNAELKEQ